LLTKIPANMPLVFLGDYIDRGPDSAGVVRIVADLVAEGRAVALKGNHEDMMLRAVCPVEPYADSLYWPDIWAYNGGETMVESVCGDTDSCDAEISPDPAKARWREIMSDFIADYRAFFDGLQIIHEDEHAVYVHAGLPPKSLLKNIENWVRRQGVRDIPREESLDVARLWIREDFILLKTRPFRDIKLIVHGHTPFQYDYERRKNKNGPCWRINLDGGIHYYEDTGCVRAVILPDREIITARRGERIQKQCGS